MRLRLVSAVPRCIALAAALVAPGVGAPAALAQSISLERAATPYDSLLEAAGDAHRYADLDEAALLLERAIELDPGRPEAYNNLGVVEMDRGGYPRAVEAFLELAHLARAQPERDTAAASYYVQAHDGLLEAGGLLLDEGAAPDAKDAFARLVELYPESQDGRHNLAIAYLDLGWWQDMLDVGRAMTANEPLSDAGWAFVQDGFAGLAADAETDAAYEDFMQRYDDVRAQIEALPLRLGGLSVDGAEGTLSGTVIGGSAPAGENVRLGFRFLGRDGVIEERTITLTTPGPGNETTFSAPGPRGPITGWAYSILD